MEFPHLGKHCSEKSCHKLDFLPMKCDSCDKVFCSEHFSYMKHSCPGAYKKDFQVPVCPLCGEPVPTPRGTSPDQTVGQHIDQYCKSDTKKIFTNRCSYKNCKKKELIPVTCTVCNYNFCLRHRHSADHECTGPQKLQRNLTANAAEYRKNNKPTTLFTTNLKPTANRVNIAQGSSQAKNIQGNMTEDEALAHALALSIMELDESAERSRRTNQESPSITAVGGQRNSKEKCSLS
ncbi:AN1-type zinc finger protein 2A [Episyrphus balteatus]|uniref:AN1-type zinc finger protein 2A n=1 Tax=Episyrphus balteatus TaxID=286459 RepID=UPI0024859D1D|nr:AN1-type zinc finger protein 2A [Episyrphus balteatus]